MPLVGDHDATALGFEVLGIAPRELRRRRRPAPAGYLAAPGRRAASPTCASGYCRAVARSLDLVADRPAYSPVGVGLFAARALEAIAPDRPNAAARRLRLPAGLARARPQGPVRALRTRARLRGRAAGLQRLRRGSGDRLARRRCTCGGRPAQREDRRPARRSPRRGARTRAGGRRSSRARRRCRAGTSRRSGGRATSTRLARQGRATAHRAAQGAADRRDGLRQPAARTSSTASTRAAWRPVAPRVVIVAQHRAEGLRSAAEQALLRQLVGRGTRSSQLARSWHGTRIHAGRAIAHLDGRPRDEDARYRDATSTSTPGRRAARPSPRARPRCRDGEPAPATDTAPRSAHLANVSAKRSGGDVSRPCPRRRRRRRRERGREPVAQLAAPPARRRSRGRARAARSNRGRACARRRDRRG